MERRLASEQEVTNFTIGRENRLNCDRPSQEPGRRAAANVMTSDKRGGAADIVKLPELPKRSAGRIVV